MNVIRTNIENLSKKDLYKLTKASGVNVKDAPVDEPVGVAAYALYTDVNSKGVESEVLAILCEDGRKLHTISATFKESFFDVVDIMEDESFSIVIKKATSKAGREFVSCELYCD